MAGKIFVNYRRDDERAMAARLHDWLAKTFGAGNLFMDVENLKAGQRFDKELERSLAQTDVFLAIIGPRWVELLAARQASGERDLVRDEIVAALKRGVTVIPVLIEGATLPRVEELPEDIREILLHHRHTLSHEQFARDVSGLVEAIRFARARSGGGGVLRSRWFWAGTAFALLAAIAGVTVHGIMVPQQSMLPLLSVISGEKIDRTTGNATDPGSGSNIAANESPPRAVQKPWVPEVERPAEPAGPAQSAAEVKAKAAAIELANRCNKPEDGLAPPTGKTTGDDAVWRASVDLFSRAVELIRDELVDKPEDRVIIAAAIDAALVCYPSERARSIRQMGPGRSAAKVTSADRPYLKSAFESFDIAPQLLSWLVDAFEAILVDNPEARLSRRLVAVALDGMIGAVDPHGEYIRPAKSSQDRVEYSGQFGGVGLEINLTDGLVKVVAPIEDTPAARAGMAADDLITHIDGATVSGLTLEEAVARMRGPVNTVVTLTVVRKGRATPFNQRINREIIRLATVKTEVIGSIGYIKLVRFHDPTYEEWKSAVADLQSKIGPQAKFVLDLRGNTGGLLNHSTGIADDLVSSGRIVRMASRMETQTKEAEKKSEDILKGARLVVLVNGGTASGGEVLVGALQDNKRAVVVGTRTYGRATIQTITPMGANGSLKLTTERFSSPSGRSFDRRGLQPDDVVEQVLPPELAGERASWQATRKPGDTELPPGATYVPTDKSKDTQLQYALTLLRG